MLWQKHRHLLITQEELRPLGVLCHYAYIPRLPKACRKTMGFSRKPNHTRSSYRDFKSSGLWTQMNPCWELVFQRIICGLACLRATEPETILQPVNLRAGGERKRKMESRVRPAVWGLALDFGNLRGLCRRVGYPCLSRVTRQHCPLIQSNLWWPQTEWQLRLTPKNLKLEASAGQALFTIGFMFTNNLLSKYGKCKWGSLVTTCCMNTVFFLFPPTD